MGKYGCLCRHTGQEQRAKRAAPLCSIKEITFIRQTQTLSCLRSAEVLQL